MAMRCMLCFLIGQLQYTGEYFNFCLNILHALDYISVDKDF